MAREPKNNRLDYHFQCDLRFESHKRISDDLENCYNKSERIRELIEKGLDAEQGGIISPVLTSTVEDEKKPALPVLGK